MKNLIYLLLLFVFVSTSFTPNRSVNDMQDAAVNPLTISVESRQPSSTESNDGRINIKVSGGKAPYIVQIMSTYSPSELYKKDYIELKKLGVGTYLILVQDADKRVLQEKVELKLN